MDEDVCFDCWFECGANCGVVKVIVESALCEHVRVYRCLDVSMYPVLSRVRVMFMMCLLYGLGFNN